MKHRQGITVPQADFSAKFTTNMNTSPVDILQANISQCYLADAEEFSQMHLFHSSSYHLQSQCDLVLQCDHDETVYIFNVKSSN